MEIYVNNTIVGILIISTFIARIWRDIESKLKLCFCCHGMMNVEVSDHRETASVRGFAVQIVSQGREITTYRPIHEKRLPQLYKVNPKCWTKDLTEGEAGGRIE